MLHVICTYFAEPIVLICLDSYAVPPKNIRNDQLDPSLQPSVNCILLKSSVCVYVFWCYHKLGLREQHITKQCLHVYIHYVFIVVFCDQFHLIQLISKHAVLNNFYFIYNQMFTHSKIPIFTINTHFVKFLLRFIFISFPVIYVCVIINI